MELERESPLRRWGVRLGIFRGAEDWEHAPVRSTSIILGNRAIVIGPAPGSRQITLSGVELPPSWWGIYKRGRKG